MERETLVKSLWDDIETMIEAREAELQLPGLLFWAPLVGRDPMPSRIGHPARLLYAFLAMPQIAFLGLAISGAGRVLYPAYIRQKGQAAFFGKDYRGAQQAFEGRGERGGHDGPEGCRADQAGDPGDGVVHARRNARLGLIDAGEDRGG